MTPTKGVFFGHLKSAKSSENCRHHREKSQLSKEWEFENGRVGRLLMEKSQKNTHSENGSAGRLRKERCQERESSNASFGRTN